MSVFPSSRRSWFSFSRPSFHGRSFHRSTAWWIALVCAVLGILGGLNIVSVPILAGNLLWVVLAGLILLLISTR